MLSFLSFVELLMLGVVVFGALYLKSRKSACIPGPVGLPLVGYIPFLGKEPHKVLAELRQKYGPVFSLYLGRSYVVVLGDFESVKKALNEASASDRPPNFFHFLPDGTGMTDSNGIEWLEQRKYTIKAMKDLGLGRSKWEKLLEDEVGDFVMFLEKSAGKPLNFYKRLSSSISNNVLTLLFGHRLPTDDPRRDIVDKGIDAFSKLHSQSSFAVYLPGLVEFLDKLGFNLTGSKLKDMKAMNRYVRNEVEKHKLPKANADSVFIEGYLKEMQNNLEQNIKNSFNERNLIGNCHSLIIGGSETSRMSLAWLFLAMAAFPKVQSKVQREVDSVLGRDGKAKWINKNKFPFIFATIMEGQRWRTILPLNLLHSTNEDTKVGEFVIPKGTAIISLIWAIHNDPKYWKDPARFVPERFLTEDGNLLPKPQGYIPFSTGKRICPGETVALIEIYLYFTTVMQKFRILPAEDGQKLDLQGNVGLVLQPLPQDLRFVLRD